MAEEDPAYGIALQELDWREVEGRLERADADFALLQRRHRPVRVVIAFMPPSLACSRMPATPARARVRCGELRIQVRPRTPGRATPEHAGSWRIEIEQVRLLLKSQVGRPGQLGAVLVQEAPRPLKTLTHLVRKRASHRPSGSGSRSKRFRAAADLR